VGGWYLDIEDKSRPRARETKKSWLGRRGWSRFPRRGRESPSLLIGAFKSSKPGFLSPFSNRARVLDGTRGFSKLANFLYIRHDKAMSRDRALENNLHANYVAIYPSPANAWAGPPASFKT
jgi:hypothetical protein